MASSSSPPPPCRLHPRWKYKNDVYVCSGKDAVNFLSHLLDAFRRESIKAFSDGLLQKGAETMPELFKAIEGSKVSVVFPNLETLEICSIRIEKIWCNQIAAACMQNLTCLIVHGCEKLKYIFPSSIVRNFVQLEHLEISYCTALEKIVGRERGEEAIATFVFPKVTFMKLWNLSELKMFYPGEHTSEWPMLKKLEVYGCDKVKIFTSEFLRFDESSEEEVHFNIPTQESLFLVEKKAVLKLEIHDEKARQKAFNIVSKFTGVISISFDMEKKKMTVIGDIDAVSVAQKLRKQLCFTELVSVGPANETKDEEREGNNEESKSADEKKAKPVKME